MKPSELWYEGRSDFGVDQIGTPLKQYLDSGFELLQGNSVFSGEIFGGCIDSIYDFFHGDRYEDMSILCKKYGLFPAAEDWAGKILLLESSEEKMSPHKYEKAIHTLKETGIFDILSGILIGKPMDETYAQPRCIIPFGITATVDVDHQIIRFYN